jgi:hypothetical protein
LANNAVTSAKIKNGEVKAEDLDPSIEIGGGSPPSFSPQVTERSNTITTDANCPPTCNSRDEFHTITVECNPDEVVTGGGLDFDTGETVYSPFPTPLSSHKDGNGWSMRVYTDSLSVDITVYAECLKIVNEGTTG